MAFGDTVQSVDSTFTGEGTVTFSAATAGNLLVVMEGRGSPHGSGGAWGTPSGWTLIHDTGINVGNFGAALYYKIAAGGETSFTTTHTNEAGNGQIAFAEFEGPFAGSPLDVSAENATNLSTVVTSQSTGTTGTTAQNDELAIAAFAADIQSNVDGGGTRNYSNSFTEVIFTDVQTARACAMLAKKILSATGTVECTFSVTDTGDEMYGVVATFKKAGGTAYNQSASGGITPIGDLLKQPAKVVAGSISPSGAVAKITSKSFAGTLTPSGALTTARIFLIALAGTLTSAGALVKDTAKALAGSLAPGGELSKLTSKSFAGTLTSSGALASVRTFVIALAGTLTSAGTLIKQTNKSVAGTLATSGAVIKETAKSFAGTLTSSGALTSVRTFVIALAGTLTSAGALIKQTNKSVAGTLTSSGTITRLISKLLSGILTSSGTITSEGGQAASNPIGRVVRMWMKARRHHIKHGD